MVGLAMVIAWFDTDFWKEKEIDVIRILDSEGGIISDCLVLFACLVRSC